MVYTKRILAAVILLVNAGLLLAQNSIIDTTGLFVKYGIWRQNSYVKNGVEKDAGYNFSKLALEFKGRTQSTALFEKGRKKERLANVISFIGSTIALVGFAVVQDEVSKSQINRSRHNWGVSAIMGGFLLELAIAVPLSTEARSQINEAVFLYNSGQ